MFYRRGQLAIFVIIVLVIVGMIVGLFAFSDKGVEIFGGSDSLFSGDVRERINVCLESLSGEALEEVLLQGGYYDVDLAPLDYVSYPLFGDSISYDVPYCYNGRDYFLISRPGIGREIKYYIEDNFFDCVNFKSFDLEIEEDFPYVYVDVLDDKLEVSLNHSFTLRKDDLSIRDSRRYEIVVESSLGNLRDSAEIVCQNLEENKGLFDLTSAPEKVNISIISVDNQGSIFVLRNFDNEESFVFASRLEGEEI